MSETSITIKDGAQADPVARPVTAPTHTEAAQLLTDWLGENIKAGSIVAVGHRIVHGGPHFAAPCIITGQVAQELQALLPFDPEHVPAELHLIQVLQTMLPDVPQAACFDTAFHHNMPPEAQLVALPRTYTGQGLRRYGFHGLSYSSLMSKLQSAAGTAADGRVVLAHLGNGVSLAAVHHGQSLDTTMGLTPAGGVPMSTRSGDLDPGVMSFLARTEHMDAPAFDRLVNFQSGLLGISGTSSDMQALLEHETTDTAAAEAVTLFCYQVKKSVGSLAAALGGLDQLVFSGGMGENAPRIRARICDGLEFLGVVLDQESNTRNAEIISTSDSRVAVRVMHTDEASVIARETAALTAHRRQSAETEEAAA